MFNNNLTNFNRNAISDSVGPPTAQMVKPTFGSLPKPAVARKAPYSAVAVAAAMLSLGPELEAWASPLASNMLSPPSYSTQVRIPKPAARRPARPTRRARQRTPLTARRCTIQVYTAHALTIAAVPTQAQRIPGPPSAEVSSSIFPSSSLLADASAVGTLSREELATVEQIKRELREAKRAADVSAAAEAKAEAAAAKEARSAEEKAASEAKRIAQAEARAATDAKAAEQRAAQVAAREAKAAEVNAQRAAAAAQRAQADSARQAAAPKRLSPGEKKAAEAAATAKAQLEVRDIKC